MTKNYQITIFHTPSCPYCHMAMDYFDAKNIEYTAWDLSKNPEKAQEMMEKSNQSGVPVIIINKNGEEKIIIGFNQLEINEILDLKE
ncbi:MAG: glutaredoxin domain-containing protein [Patescibacteria group bacterium]|nr:glutaredoxin domain-containing protein [Patescibacteria group bacterium]